ncbi:MAG: tetratricopeptide repeat protein, partial [Acidobacteriota bacterium]
MTRSSLLWIRGALALVSLFSALPIVRAAAQSTTDHSAVWIETVEPDSALARAGLLVGDALSQWQGLEAAGRIRQQGRLTSMADWHRLVHEQAPRGAVRLIGRRAGAAITFEVQPGPWLATVRPQLSLELATAYTNGRKRLQNGERPAAIDAWQAAAEQAIRHGEATAAAWLLRTIGEAHTAARQWQLAQAAYEAARRQTTTPTGEALLRHAAARAYADQGVMDRATAELEQGLALWHTVPDAELSVAACLVELAELARRQRQLERAQSLLDEALASQAALAPGSLAMAESLSLRGTLSFYRGDLEAAGASFQQALDLQQRLAPAGLEIATSHNRLGAVAWRLGRLDEAKGHFERALAIRQALAPNSLDVAGTLNNLALVTQRLSDFDATEAALQRAAALYQSLAPNTLAQANTTTNLGVLALTRGHLEEAS